MEKYCSCYSQDQNYYKKRQETRLKISSKVLEEFKTYIETELSEALPQNPLGKPLAYTRKLLPSFGLFLEDGALQLDNNGAERGIKPFVIGRKNWLFSNTKKGALSSATIYSIIEKGKANHLIVEKYLIYLMDIIANRNPLDDEEDLLKSMPWSGDLPDYLKIEDSK